MDNNLIATQSIEISTNAKNVWEILTNPEEIKKFLFGTETITDWKEGSAIIFQGNYNGQEYKDKGNVIKNEKHKTLSYLYWSGFSGLEDKLENYCKVTYKIEELNENTIKFTWTQKGFASEESQCHTENGLKAMLEQIKELAEN